LSKLRFSKSEPRHVVAFVGALMVSLTGCGENIFDLKWSQARVDTVFIYSLARPELNLPSAFDFVNRITWEVEAPGATGLWDLLLDTKDGQLVFVPPGGVDVASAAMILELPETAFDDVVRAPKDTTLYSKDVPVIVKTSSVYVLRTHRGQNQFGVPCSFFGKIHALDVEPAGGSVRFEYDVSTLCDDRALIPPDA
jgi:hypothetical protein